MTDLQALRALLSQPDGKLSPSEKRAFQQMYDNVAAGMVIQLSKKQRLWVDGVYAKLKESGTLQTGSKRVEVKDKQLLKPRLSITPRGQATLNALRQRAKELGLPDPVPESEYPKLVAAISPDVMKVITTKAEGNGYTVEELAIAYVKKLLQASQEGIGKGGVA